MSGPKTTAKPCRKWLRSHWLRLLAADHEAEKQGTRALLFLLNASPAEREREGYQDALALIGRQLVVDVEMAGHRFGHAVASIEGIAQ
jgi:hypothetical protein